MNDKYLTLLRDAVGNLPLRLNTPAHFRAWKRTGNLLWISGQIPRFNEEVQYKGRVGDTITVAQARLAAKLCAANIFLILDDACGGDLDLVDEAVRLTGYVRCSESFGDQPTVIDAASEVFTDVLGLRGVHARSAIGVYSLPALASVELEAIFLLR